MRFILMFGNDPLCIFQIAFNKYLRGSVLINKNYAYTDTFYLFSEYDELTSRVNS